MGVAEIQKVLNRVVDAYKIYPGDNKLVEVYKIIKQKLLDWADQEKTNKARQLADLDRKFGGFSTIRPTALGNVVEAYNAYPYKRYGIEGEFFWPHLEFVLHKDFRERISDTRLLLDFFLTMATLGTLTAIFSFVIGPWLNFSPLYWATIGTIAILVSYCIYYKMAVFIAVQYGDLIRASFDLFRLELFNNFKMARPKDLASEVQKWKDLNQLIVFGNKMVNYDYNKGDDDATG
jgi:hypothetical protein